MTNEAALDAPTSRPTEQTSSREQILENLANEVAKALRKGSYSSVEGSPAETKSVVDKILKHMDQDHLVLRYAVPQEGTTLPQITEGFVAIAPQGSAEGMTEGSSATMSFGDLFEQIASGSDKPVVAILENIEHVDERWRGDVLRRIRGFFNGRASDESLRKETWLLTGTASPNELLSPDQGTPYNIGTHFTIP